jgi:hypothetical protein
MTLNMPAVLLGQSSPEEDIRETLEPEEEFDFVHPVLSDEHTHLSAFMIIIDLDGNYIFEPDINVPIVPKRKPTASEVKGAMSAILMDIQAQETAILSAQTTVNAQMQMAMQMQEAQKNAQIAQQLARKPGHASR